MAAAKARRTRRKSRKSTPWAGALAERLCRTAEGVPLREIARCTGYNHETIRRYMLRGNVPAHFVVVFADAFDVSPVWVLTGRGRR
jgi:hypothetical protein